MTDTLWSFTPLAGLALAFVANVLRARRTRNMSCLGHVFVSADQMTTAELVLNRTGVVVFLAGVIVALIV